jgi:nucleoid-associated protein YgaU
VVRRGDSLASIAAQVYDDPSAWRAIARANASRTTGDCAGHQADAAEAVM